MYFDAEWACGCAGIEDEPEFAIGDVVSLIVGGPEMVVISLCECGMVEVAWSDSAGDVVIDAFPVEALVEVDW